MYARRASGVDMPLWSYAAYGVSKTLVGRAMDTGRDSKPSTRGARQAHGGVKRRPRPISRWTRFVGWVFFTGVLATLASVVAVATMDRWLFVLLDPGPFDPTRIPQAPDYATEGAWAAHPEREDGADVSLPSHPAIDPSSAPADVFYLHPTTWVGREWNAAPDDPAVIEATHRGAMIIQASVFNACCAVYAPRYRQAHGRAYTHPSADGQRAADVAYSDVSTAFNAFLDATGNRPFIVAGHSQGAVLAARLIRERIAGSELRDRLVAAYLPGAPVRSEELRLPVCDHAQRIGCAVSYHARGPNFVPNDFEFHADHPDPMAGRVCVNPLSWRVDDIRIPAAKNAGAIFFDTRQPRVLPQFADARCSGGVLQITQLGDLQRDLMSHVLLYVIGPENYHPIEYQTFYLDLRANAVDRVTAWKHTHVGD